MTIIIMIITNISLSIVMYNMGKIDGIKQGYSACLKHNKGV